MTQTQLIAATLLCSAIAMTIGLVAGRRHKRLKRIYAGKNDASEIAKVAFRARRNIRLSVGAFVLGFFALYFAYGNSAISGITTTLSIVLVFVFLAVFLHWRTEQIVANARLKELSGGATNKRNSLEVEN